jgi:hypothetical protein
VTVGLFSIVTKRAAGMQAAKVGHDSLKFPQMEPNGKQPIKMSSGNFF